MASANGYTLLSSAEVMLPLNRYLYAKLQFGRARNLAPGVVYRYWRCQH